MKVFARAATATAIVSALAFVSAPAHRAQARIACDGPYQIVQGSALATPYCEDAYLAAVARGYGIRISDVAVRQNPNIKAEVCRAVGHDNRVRQICAGYLPGDRGGRFKMF